MRHDVKYFSTVPQNGKGTAAEQAVCFHINQQIVLASQRVEERFQGAPPTPRAILRVLDDMQDLWMKHRHEVNVINASTMIHRIGLMAEYLESSVWTNHSLLLNQLLDYLQDNSCLLQPRNAANIVWGIGRLKRADQGTRSVSVEKVVYEIVEHGTKGLSGFQSQHISNLLIGLAYMRDTQCRPLLPTILAHGKEILDQFRPQELSNTIWALARLEYVDLVDFLPAAMRCIEKSLAKFSPRQIAIVMWALAVFQSPECDAILDAAVSTFNAGAPCPHSIAVALWSLLQLRIRLSDNQIDSMIQPIADCLSGKPSPGRIRDLTTVLAVLADYGFQSAVTAAIRDTVMDCLASHASCFSPQDIGNFLWSLTIRDDPILQWELLRQCLVVLEMTGIERMKNEDIRQFYQSLLHLKVFRQKQQYSLAMPHDRELRWKTIWCVRQATSPLPLWVASALVMFEDMGYQCKGRVLEQGLINTSVLDLKDPFKYAVEGITYLRTFRNQPDRPSGRYLWKVRLLESMDYEVIRIKESEWTSLSLRASKEQYLKEKIQLARTHALRKLQ